MIETQCERLLQYLWNHPEGMTKREGEDNLGIMNVGGRIFDLRRQGNPIQSEMIPVKNRFGETCHVKRYRLVKEEVNAQNK